MSDESSQHIPVLQQEVLQLLAPSAESVLVDGTAGGGGHLQTLLQPLGPAGKLIGIDRDPQAIERLQRRFAHPQLRLICNSYCAATPDSANTADPGRAWHPVGPGGLQ